MRWFVPEPKKKIPLSEWHPWWAWHTVADGNFRAIFETVQRKGIWVSNPHYGRDQFETDEGHWEWEYQITRNHI
jgi:hypothetical protein